MEDRKINFPKIVVNFDKFEGIAKEKFIKHVDVEHRIYKLI